MQRAWRLRGTADFQRVREQAARGWPDPLLVLYAAPNELGVTRVGITASRRVGKAVVRNRVRRRIREALRLRYTALARGYDLVVVVRPASAQASWHDLQVALERVLTRARLWTVVPRQSSTLG